MENIKIIITIDFLIFVMIMFFWEKWPVAFTAMTVLVGLIVAGILEPKKHLLVLLIQLYCYIWPCL